MSKTTAHRALAGEPHISAEKRDRALAAAKELGYAPDPYFAALSARRRRTGSTRLTLAYLHTDRAGPKSSRRGMNLTAELRQRAPDLGFDIEPLNPDHFDNPARMLRQLWSRGAAGILVGGVYADTAAALRDFGKLPVLCFMPDVELPFHAVHYSASQPLELCWRKLRERGHRRIGCAVFRHEPEVLDDARRLGAALSMAERELRPSERIPPLRALMDADAFRKWVWRHQPEAVIAFSPGYSWFCKNRAGDPIPFASLHADLGDLTRHIPGAAQPRDVLVECALRRMDDLIRHGDCGVPARATELVLPATWHEGVPH